MFSFSPAREVGVRDMESLKSLRTLTQSGVRWGGTPVPRLAPWPDCQCPRNLFRIVEPHLQDNSLKVPARVLLAVIAKHGQPRTFWDT